MFFHHVNVHIQYDSSEDIIVDSLSETHHFRIQLSFFVSRLLHEPSPKGYIQFQSMSSIQDVFQIKTQNIIPCDDIWIVDINK